MSCFKYMIVINGTLLVDQIPLQHLILPTFPTMGLIMVDKDGDNDKNYIKIIIVKQRSEL